MLEHALGSYQPTTAFMQEVEPPTLPPETVNDAQVAITDGPSTISGVGQDPSVNKEDPKQAARDAVEQALKIGSKDRWDLVA